MANDTVRLQRRPTLRNEPGIFHYAIGDATSTLGDAAWVVAATWTAAGIDAKAAALVVGAVEAPQLILGMMGGAAVDRFGPWRAAITCDVLKLAIMAGTAIGVAVNLSVVPLLVGAGLLFGAVSAVHTPAIGAVLPTLVTSAALERANGLCQGLCRAATVLGAPLGGWIVGVSNLGVAALANAMSFAVSGALLLVALRQRRSSENVDGTSQRDGGAFWHQVLAGISFLRRSPLVTTVLIVGAGVNFAASGPLSVGLPLLSHARGWGSAALGLLVGGIGLGGASSAFLTMMLPHLQRPALLAFSVLGLQMAAIVGLSSVSEIAAAVLLATAVGVAGGAASVQLLSVVQRETPASYMGRVMSVALLLNVGLAPAAYFAFAVLSDATSVPAAFFIAGTSGALLVAAGVGMPAVRRKCMETFDA